MSLFLPFDIYCQSQEVDSTPDSDSIPTVNYSCAEQFPNQVSNPECNFKVDTGQWSGLGGPFIKDVYKIMERG